MAYIENEAFNKSIRLTSVIFEGDAPLMGNNVFDEVADDFTIYYYEGTNGWTESWNGYNTVMLSKTNTEFLISIRDDVIKNGLEKNLAQIEKTVILVFDNREFVLSTNANNVNISGEIDLGDGYFLMFDIAGNGKNVKRFDIIYKG